MYKLLRSSSIGILLLIISAAFLFRIKYDVLEIRRDIKQIEASILKVSEDIHILKAEWSYLTKPERIAKIVSQKKLKLESISPNKIIYLKVEEIPEFLAHKHETKSIIKEDEVEDKTT